jgi:AraC-like DNA-binding protein
LGGVKMNFDIVERLIEFIENNNCVIDNECIKSVTGNSAGYVRNEFKKIVGMTLDKYRIRRRLSIIIEKVKESGKILSSYDLSPWGSRNSFNKAFKKEFNMAPSEFIRNYDEELLQPRYNITFAREGYDEESRLLTNLIRNYKGVRPALLFLISLPPYELNFISKVFINREEDLPYFLIKDKYAEHIGEKFFVGDVPKKYYMEHKRDLERYYNKYEGISLDKNEYTIQKEKISLQNILSNDYLISNRSLIEKLKSKVDFPNLLYCETSPVHFRTIWYERLCCEDLTEDFVAIPNVLLHGSKFNLMEDCILRELIFSEQGHRGYNTWEEFVETIYYDFDKVIDNQAILCASCRFKNECSNDGECRLYDDMSEEEQLEFDNKPEWESLSLEKLMKEIANLIKRGFIYVKMGNSA